LGIGPFWGNTSLSESIDGFLLVSMNLSPRRNSEPQPFDRLRVNGSLFFANGGMKEFSLQCLYNYGPISKVELPDEFADVLRRPKFNDSAASGQWMLTELMGIVEYVNPTMKLEVIVDDPDDNRVLECAMEAGAHCIISGEGHLEKMPLPIPSQGFCLKMIP